MKRRNSKGFTLGEVLLVVAIISALTAIGIPSLMKEIDKAKLRVDQAHVQEAVSMATSQYAADHTEGKRWYYYDANRSEIQKDTSEGIHGYGKSTKEPYKHNTHVTDTSASSVPVGDDGTRNLVEVTVNVEHGVSTITSSWVQSGNHPYTPPQHNKDNSDKKTFGDVEITAAGSWPLKGAGKDFPTENTEPYVRIQYGYVYTYNNEFYLVKNPGENNLNMNWYNWYPPEERNATIQLSSSMFDKVYTQEEFENKFSGAPYNKHIEGNKYVFKANDGVLYVVITEYPFNSDGKIAADSLKDTGRFCPLYGAVLKRK